MDTKLVAQTAIRAAGLTALTGIGLLAAYWDARDSSSGANIGLGLLMLVGQALVASVWAGVDARRYEVAPVVAVWVAAAVLGSLGGLVISRLLEAGESGWSWTVFASDLLLVVPTQSALIIVGASIGAMTGAALRGGPPRAQRG